MTQHTTCQAYLATAQEIILLLLKLADLVHPAALLAIAHLDTVQVVKAEDHAEQSVLACNEKVYLKWPDQTTECGNLSTR